ncbi:MAG: AMP-binding enzyme, partial [Sphingopyxis sp.]
PHEVLGEDIAAAVTLRPGAETTTPEQIIDFCKTHLADNKVPRTLVVMDEMPLNPNGKILKRDLAEPLAQAAEARRRAA